MVQYLKFTNTAQNGNYTSPVLYVNPAKATSNTDLILKYPAYVTTGSMAGMPDTSDYGQYFVIRDWPATPISSGYLQDPATATNLLAPLYNPASAGFLNTIGQITNISSTNCRLVGSQTFLSAAQSDQFLFQATGITPTNQQKVRIIKKAAPGDTLGNQFVGYTNTNGAIVLVNTPDPTSVPAPISIEWVVDTLNTSVSPKYALPPAKVVEELVDY